MPLTPYKRGNTWWAKGRVEYNGRPITSYSRFSTGAPTEAGARAWIADHEERTRRIHLFGEEKVLTFADIVLDYPAKPAEAKFLDKLLDDLGPKLVSEITAPVVKALARKLYPDAATDTWRRQVLTPVSAVINHAHQLGRCPPIRIKGFSAQERIDQDARRGKLSRQPRPAADWTWIRAVQAQANPWVSAALEFMFETGARVGQVIALEPQHLDLAAGRVWIAAQKGHQAQWIEISPEMVATLAALKPRRPRDWKRDRQLAETRVFGYANRTGLTSALRTACKAAGQPYLTPHEAGRRGFYTELRVRQGFDPVTAAKAGRWSDPVLPDRRYAEAGDGRAARAAIRAGAGTNRVQPESKGENKTMKSQGK